MRGKPEREIIALLAGSGYKLCDMFEADRIRISTPLPKWRKWAAAAVLTLGFSALHQTLMAQHTTAPTTSKTDTTRQKSNSDATFGFVVDDRPAEYPGGNEKFQQYVMTQVRPNASCKPGQKGFFYFVVDKDGSVVDVKVIRSPFDDEMNAGILKIISQSKKWRPGFQNGRVMRSAFTVPVIPIPQ